VLDQVMRQEGDDERSRLFRETLAELRDYGPDGISDRALQFLRSRVKTRLSREEVSRFDDALTSCSRKRTLKIVTFTGLPRCVLPLCQSMPAITCLQPRRPTKKKPRVYIPECSSRRGPPSC